MVIEKRQRRKKMIVNKSFMVSILDKLKVGLLQKGVVEQYKYIIFDGEYIKTFNGKICVFFPFKTDFICAVPSNELIRIIKGMHDEEISLEIINNQFIISSENVDSGLNTMKDVDDCDMGPLPRLFRLPEDFKQALDLCSFCCSTDVTDPLNGVYVKGDNVYGSDDIRISHCKIGKELKFPFLIPLESVLSLKDFNIIKYGFNEGWIFFKDLDGSFFCSRLIDQDYNEDPSEFFEFEGKEIIFPDGMKEMVEKVLVLVEGDSDIEKKINVVISEGKLTCKASNDKGWINTHVVVPIDKDITFSINPLFFIQILNKVEVAVIGEDRILFETEKFKHLIALHQEE